MTVPTKPDHTLSGGMSPSSEIEPLPKTLKDAARLRAELLATIAMDGLLLFGGYLVASALSWGVNQLHPSDPHWSLRVLAFLMDLGLVGTVVTITAFDLAKRIKHAYRLFREL